MASSGSRPSCVIALVAGSSTVNSLCHSSRSLQLVGTCVGSSPRLARRSVLATVPQRTKASAAGTP